MAGAGDRSFRLTISYDGTAYFGWQSQTGGNTIQQTLVSAIAAVCGQRVTITGSGRTDAGVHALAQVASFSLDTSLSPVDLQRALNANLPGDIRILAAQEVDSTFCAQRSATSKRYVYVLQDGRIHDVFRRRYCWFVRGWLDVPAIRLATRHLVGKHDFVSFQAAGSPAPRRSDTSFDWASSVAQTSIVARQGRTLSSRSKPMAFSTEWSATSSVR